MSSPTEIRPGAYERHVRVIAWVVLLVLGAVQAWNYRHVVGSPDSIAYLEVAETYVRDGWRAGLNGCWSPLYSWLLIPLVSWFHPSPLHEMAAVHAFNLGVYALALLAFELLLSELFQASSTLRDATPGERGVWRALAYAVFAWGCLHLVSPAVIYPDLLVAGLTYASTALLLRARRDGGRRNTLLALGAVAGLAALAKAAMFPIGFLTLATAAVVSRGDGGWRRGLRAGATALAPFVLLAAPFVVSLSLARGRPTFGDAGRLNYAWKINGVQRFTHWQGGDGFGEPVHRPRVLLAMPVTFEFATPLPGTYPLWYDPSYWYEGVQPRADLKGSLRAAEKNLWEMAKREAAVLLPMAVLLVALYALRRLRPAPWDYWLILVPPAATVVMYALVLLSERYVAGQLSTLLLGALAGSSPALRRPRAADAEPADPAPPPPLRRGHREPQASQSPQSEVTQVLRGGVRIMLYAALVVMVVNLARWGGGIVSVFNAGGMPDRSGQVAQELHAAGVPEGARVGLIGSGLFALWARPAHVRIIAETADAYGFWTSPPEIQAEAITALRLAGASAVVAVDAPGCDRWPGWRMLFEAASSDHRGDGAGDGGFTWDDICVWTGP